MIELSDRVVAIWFLDLDTTSNFMACLEEVGEELYRITCRFRFEDWEDKNWYNAEFYGSKERALDLTRKSIRLMEESCGEKADEIMASSAEEYIQILRSKDYLLVREPSEDEAEMIRRFMAP